MMGIFSGNKRRISTSTNRIIAPATISRLPEVGRAAFENPLQPWSPQRDVSDFYYPGLKAIGFPSLFDGSDAWSVFVEKFVAELDAGAAELGGWAYAGAFYVAMDLVGGEDFQKPLLIPLMDRGLEFLIGAGVGSVVIPPFALPRFTELQRQRS